MIGQLVNRVCDIFDKPSTKEVSPKVVDFLAKAVNYGFVAVMFIMAFLLITALQVSGALTIITWVLFPVSYETFDSLDGFFTTVGRFAIHYTLIGFYVLLVMLGLGRKEGD